MKILRAYRVKLDPIVEQRKQLARQTGAARFVFNWGLTEWKAQYERAKADDERAKAEGLHHVMQQRPSWMALHKQLTQLKKTDFPWLQDISAYVVREALADLGDAYKHFFRKLQAHTKGNHSECRAARDGHCQLGEPNYRGRSDPAGRGFRVAQPQAIKLACVGTGALSDRLTVAGVGEVRISWDHRGKIPLGANYRGLGIRQVAGDWYAAVQVEEEREDRTPSTARAGVEVGVRVLTVVTDTGRVGVPIRDLPNLPREQRRLALWSRRMARRHVRGKKSREQSRGWKECVDRVQTVHARIAEMRKDAIHQATSRIVRKSNSGVLVVRDSQVHRMLGRAGKEGAEMRKRNALAPSVANAAMFEVRRQIEYKQRWRGGETVVAPSDYPSTRRCSTCGVVRDTDPGYPSFHCPACGTTMDREENSARNLRQFDPENFSPKNISGRKRRPDWPSESGSNPVQRPDESEHSTAGASMASSASPDGVEGASPTSTLGAGNRAAEKSVGTDAKAIQPEGEHLPHTRGLHSTSAEVTHTTRPGEIKGLRAVGNGAGGGARKPSRIRTESLRESRERRRS